MIIIIASQHLNCCVGTEYVYNSTPQMLRDLMSLYSLYSYRNDVINDRDFSFSFFFLFFILFFICFNHVMTILIFVCMAVHTQLLNCFVFVVFGGFLPRPAVYTAVSPHQNNHDLIISAIFTFFDVDERIWLSFFFVLYVK
jgi:hypothetical protein